jgi:hypothetical protein
MGGSEKPVVAPTSPQSPPLQVALLRAAVGGLILAASMFLTAYTQSNQLKPALLSAGATFVGYLILRGVAEGWIDTVAIKSV